MKARPFLKWVGGKRQLLPEILKRVPRGFCAYREPFLGGGALFFELQLKGPQRHVRTYRAVRDGVEEVVRRLREHRNEEAYFYALRAKDPQFMEQAECAAWLIYLNKTCFNGLYRVNRKGLFNSPFGRYVDPPICDADNLRACSEALQEADIHLGDFSLILREANPGDFVYCDPPYVPLSPTSSFTSYTAQGFGAAQHEALRDEARKAKDRGVSVLLSNSSAPLVRELYESFDVREVMASRAINSKALGRGKVPELLIS